MRKKRQSLLVAVVLLILLAIIALSASEVAVYITKPLNQSYNATCVPTTVNATTSNSAGCKFMLNAREQGQNWTLLNSSAAWAARYGADSVVTPDGKIWLIGGSEPYYSTYYNDVWYSTDGANWTLANASAAWEPRYLHSVIATSDGTIWLMGGYNSSLARKNDVWKSTDGANWTLVNESVAWEPRYGQEAIVTSDDIMWIIAGVNSSSLGNYKMDVWNSTDGANWTLVNATAIPERYMHSAVVGANNKIWVMGGLNSTPTYLHDVWYSDDRINWLLANASALWGGRYSHSSVYTNEDERIWVMGGFHNIMGYLQDVYYSEDGANWSVTTTTAGWSARQLQSSVVALNGSILVFGGAYGTGTNDVWYSKPYTNMDGGSTAWGKEFAPLDGSNIVYVQCRNALNGAAFWNSTNVSFYVDTILPVLTISSPLNITYNNTASRTVNATVSETASSCLYSLNGDYNVTMDGSGTEWGKEFTAAQGSNTIVVSCNDSVDNWNSTAVTFFLDSIKPILNITSPLNTTYSTTSLTANVTTNESASICKYSLNTNGIDENWTTLNASALFTGRYGFGLVNTSDGTMWIIGGAYDVTGITTYINSVWNSTDGINWVLVNNSPAFSARAYHTSVVDNTGKMWVIAGYDGTNYLNDTWYSTDGITWTQANASAFSGRYGHSSVVDNDGKMWVIGGLISAAGADPPIISGEVSISKGGGTPVTTNTTWYSTDGYAWIQANSSAFPSRYLHTSIVSSDSKIWVIGGIYTAGVGTEAYYSDAWYSNDSASWVRATNSAAFDGRFAHASVATPDSRIWLLGGQDANNNEYNDVWYSTNGSDWTLANASSAWSQRSHHSALYLNNAIYLIGGRDVYTQGLNDTYKTSPIPARYYSMFGSGTAWWNNFTATQGNNDINVKCYDIAGNMNTSMQWFTVDILGPAITISSPLNQSYTTASTTLTVSLSESASTCVYSLNGAANVTMTGSGASWSASATAANGGNTITVSCRDALGNWNSTSVAFYVSVSSDATCGNNVCETGETCTSCSADCGACTGGTSGSLSGGVSSSNAAKDTGFNLIANLPFEKTIEKEGIAVEKVTLNSNQNAEKVNLQISKYDTLPRSIKAPEGNMYQALEIELDKKVDLKESEICFNVEKQWMETNEVQKEEVVLVRYNPRQVLRVEKIRKQDGTIKAEVRADIELWQELVTTWVEKPVETNTETYCAKTPGFSTFAIVAKKQRTIEVIEEIAPIIESIQKPVPEKNEFVIPFSPPFKKLYTMLLINLFLIFVLIAAFSTGGNLYEEKKEIWYQCNEMVRKAPDSKKLKEFIKASLKRGYSENDVKQAIAGHGIDETCVEMFIENVKQEIIDETPKGK